MDCFKYILPYLGSLSSVCQCLNKTWFILLGRNLYLATCSSENDFSSCFGTWFSKVLRLCQGDTEHHTSSWSSKGGVKSLSTSMIRHFVTALKLFYQKELLFSWHLLCVSLSLLCRLFLPSFCNRKKFDPGVMVTNPFEPWHYSFSYHQKPSMELQLSIISLLFSHILWHMGLKVPVYYCTETQEMAFTLKSFWRKE